VFDLALLSTTHRPLGILLAALCLAFGIALPARAQQPVEPSEAARFRWGALRFTPSLAITDVGIDNNVFNEAEHRKQDTTAAIGPAAALWMNLGRGRLSGKASGQYLYFKEYENQRSWNTNVDMRLQFPLVRIKPFVAGTYVNTRERPGFEIDSRARRRDQTVSIGTDIRLSGKTSFVVSAGQARFAYDKNETFLGAELARVLDRRADTETLQLRYILTPLTTFVVSTEATQDRFVIQTIRNADSIRVMPGFELKPFALISGRVGVGFRHFNALSPDVPDYNGVIASVDAQYSMAATNFHVTVNRDLNYSFEAQEPYYALTDSVLTITQRVTRVWDIVGRGGRQSLAYRRFSSLTGESSTRVDHGTLVGLGVGYRLGKTVRLGIDANYYQRESPTANLRDFEGLRVGASVSYGLPQ
jgi:hypothetical protein